MQGQKVLIVGASSAIAEATARRLAQRGACFYLVARNPHRLEAVAADLRVRGGEVAGGESLDCNDIERHGPMLDRAERALGRFDLVLIAHGTLPAQGRVQDSVGLVLQEVHTNALSMIALCTLLAPRLERQRAGVLAVLSSVAGDRGRATNYVYGAAKALVTTFLSGMRQRLHRSGVAVVTIKPGFVDTPMTRDYPKGALWASANSVAGGIVRAIDHRQAVAYVPGFWRFVMLAIRAVPERLFVRMTF